MGTNYYAYENTCKYCHKHIELHLGKASYGWTFSFQYNGGRYYKNVQEMKEFLKGKEIKDEYGETISNDDFWSMIEERQKNKENKKHAEYVRTDPRWSRYYDKSKDFLLDGYSFSDCDFS